MFLRAVQCKTPALGRRLYASETEEREFCNTCKSRMACASCGSCAPGGLENPLRDKNGQPMKFIKHLAPELVINHTAAGARPCDLKRSLSLVVFLHRIRGKSNIIAKERRR